MTVEQLENGAERFVTAGGVAITRQRHDVPYAGAIETYVDGLNSRRGAVFSSNYEYPGRYTRWDTATIDPPVAISARGRVMKIAALNAAWRGAAAGDRPGGLCVGFEKYHHRRDNGKADPPGRGQPPRLRRRRAFARAIGVHGAARHHGAVPHQRGPKSRALRRLRLRPRLPVRPGRPQARTQGKPARPRTLSA